MYLDTQSCSVYSFMKSNTLKVMTTTHYLDLTECKKRHLPFYWEKEWPLTIPLCIVPGKVYVDGDIERQAFTVNEDEIDCADYMAEAVEGAMGCRIARPIPVGKIPVGAWIYQR